MRHVALCCLVHRSEQTIDRPLTPDVRLDIIRLQDVCVDARLQCRVFPHVVLDGLVVVLDVLERNAQGDHDDVLEGLDDRVPVRISEPLRPELLQLKDTRPELPTDLPLAGILGRGTDHRGHDRIPRSTRGHLLRGHPESVVHHRRHHTLHGVHRRLLHLDLDLHILVQEEDRDHGREQDAHGHDPRPPGGSGGRGGAGLSRRLLRGRRGLDLGDLLVDLPEHRGHPIDLVVDRLGVGVDLTLERADVLVDIVPDLRDGVLHAVTLADDALDLDLQTFDQGRRLLVHLSHGLLDRGRDEVGDVPQLGVGRVELLLELVLLVGQLLCQRGIVADDLVLLARDLADEDLVLFAEIRGGEQHLRVVVVPEAEVFLTEVPLLLELGLGVDHNGRLLALLDVLGRGGGDGLFDLRLFIGLDLTLDLVGLGIGLDHHIDLSRVVLVRRHGCHRLRVRRSAALHGRALLVALLVAVNHF